MFDIVLGPPRHFHAGGAGTVVSALAALGADSTAVGWVQPGRFASIMANMLPGQQQSSLLAGLPRMNARMSRRWIQDHSQFHLLKRVDHIEIVGDVGDLIGTLHDRAIGTIGDSVATIVSDTVKLPGGLVTPGLLRGLVDQMPCVVSSKRLATGLPGLILIVSDEDVGMHTLSTAALKEVAQKIGVATAVKIIITRGSRGVVWWSGGIPRSLAAKGATVKCDVGAGDTFAAAFTVNLLESGSVDDSVAFACEKATLSVATPCIGLECSARLCPSGN